MDGRMSDILAEARGRFKAVELWESTARRLYLDDVRFGQGDSDNGWQWPDHLRRSRDREGRPALTVNKVRQHCLQIVNDARQNKVAIQITPTGDQASYEAAQAFEDVVRHIEYRSHAEGAYIHAVTNQVFGGVGYWRVLTEYVDEDSFDQEIKIQRIVDPLTVYMDPDCQERDKSDARFAFVFEDLPWEEFKAKYPQYADHPPAPALDKQGWITKDHVRVAEYYTRSEKRDTLFYYVDEHGQAQTAKKSALTPELIAQLEENPETKSREIVTQDVKWYFIVGDQIADKRDWPGKYIPIVCIVGEETVVEGRMDRKGHVRQMKDPQRMFNYWASAAVEYAGLQSKTPWVVDLDSIEGVEELWANANRANLAYLPYKSHDGDGRELPAPQRPPPPAVPPAFVALMESSEAQLAMVSGQQEASLGEPSNERSGVAIQQRQRQGDNATYHYLDNLAVGIRFTGRILIDLIPKVYDTPRVLQILADNGDKSELHIDPDQPEALLQQGAVRIFNPSVGRFEVESDVGPAFATRRQEAFAALTHIASLSPEIMAVAGDLVMRAADFPMADELAERLKRMVPPQALGGPNLHMQQMQAQMQQMHMTIQMLSQSLKSKQQDAINLARERAQQKIIDAYNAETNRIKALGGSVSPEMVMQLVHDALNTHLTVAENAGDPALAV